MSFQPIRYLLCFYAIIIARFYHLWAFLCDMLIANNCCSVNKARPDEIYALVPMEVSALLVLLFLVSKLAVPSRD
eukprot:11192899-Prorocentrum_lima.AAC.1